jgi:hypothetical protein
MANFERDPQECEWALEQILLPAHPELLNVIKILPIIRSETAVNWRRAQRL